MAKMLYQGHGSYRLILDDGTVQGLIDKWLAAYTSDIPMLEE